MNASPQWDPGNALLSRRTLLTAAGGVVALAATMAVTKSSQVHEPLRRTIGALSVPERLGLTRVETVHSVARRRDVELLISHPGAAGGPDADELPACLVLHGLGGNARATTRLALGGSLRDMTAAGTSPPFVLVAVDGGDNYWHESRPGDDPMAMLLDEVPQWLRERGYGGIAGLPFACTGFSMGGFGALLYARRRSEHGTPLAAAAAISPALITSWQTMRTRGIFRSQRSWEEHDPLRHPNALSGVRVGVWCGVRDQFADGVRRFIQTAAPDVGYIGRGDHSGTFAREVAGEVIRFLARSAPMARNAPVLDTPGVP